MTALNKDYRLNSSISKELFFAFGGKNKVFTGSEKCTPNEKISLFKLIELIKSDAPTTALKVRSICKNGFDNSISPKEIKTQIKPYKNALPFVLFSGFCPVHHNDKTLLYNGCVQIDIDFKFSGGDDKAKFVKNACKKLPFAALVAISPSGYGVKLLVPTTNLDIENHSKVSKALIFELSKTLDIENIYFDNLGASQPCFIPFDKDVFLNHSVIEYNHFESLYKYELHQRQLIEKQLKTAKFNAPQRNLQSNIENGSVSVPKIDILKYLTAQIVQRGLNVTDGYNNWFLVAQSYASVGEDSRSLFHDVAALHNDYDFEANEKKFVQGLKFCNNNSIGFLVNLCKKHGVTINDFCKDWIKENAPKNNNLTAFLRSKKTIEHQYILNDNQFIGDVLNSSFCVGLHYLIGGTGVGKTYFTAQSFKKTVIVSRNITTLENYEKYGFERFKMEDIKTDFGALGDGSKITVTYKSLKNLLGVMNKDGYTFVFDEYHLLLDSYRNVRKETHFAYKCVYELQRENVVILASANNVLLTDSRLKTKSKHVFKKPSVKRFVNIEYNAKYNDLQKLIFAHLESGKKVLLYTNRKEKKEVSENLKISFSHKYSMTFFDATKHNDIDLSRLESDITICTKALTTGKDIVTKNLAVVIYCNDYDMKTSVINQFFGRARDYKTASFDLLFTFKPNNNEYQKPNINSLMFGCKEIAKAVQIASVNDSAFRHENDKYFVEKVGSELIVNYFSIDNHIESQVSKCTIRNTVILTDFLSRHGYESLIKYIEVKEPEKRIESNEIKPSEKYVNEIDEINKENLDYEFETVAKDRFCALKSIGFSDKESLMYSLKFDTKASWIKFCKILRSEKRLGTNDTQYKKDYCKVLEVLQGEKTLNDIIVNVQKLRSSKTQIGRLIKQSKQLELNDIKSKRKFINSLRFFYDIQSFNSAKINTKIYIVEPTEFIKISERSTILDTDIDIAFSLSEIMK